ncbi:glutathione S-transferase family protein [Noviherbaspirillum aerium]|uniref:glutathione S-transferase family protein n=1 Tax=Noviherbaspirillum aerium TaxID=2588497 RepID=UPI00124DF9B5|nr:glutathione S-transferase [Noviherbaspirillum aerium]
MLTLYHCVSARSFRPLWMLEELRLPYELRMLPFPPRAAARDYLAVNPLGTVPALLDGGLRMTESAAICQYLAARGTPGVRGAPGTHGALDVAAGDPAFGEYLNWLHFGEASLTFPQTLVLRYGRFEPEERRQPQVAEDYRRWFLARLRGVDAVVARQEHLCAQRFTAADVSVGYALMLAELIGLEPEFSEPVRAYWQRLQQREGYRRAMDAQERAAIEQGVSPLPATVTGTQA